MSRAQVESAVDELAAAHSGEAFAAAVRHYSATLDGNDREELKAVLLERARLLEGAVGERYRARGWMHWTLNRIERLERLTRSPPDHGPHR